MMEPEQLPGAWHVLPAPFMCDLLQLKAFELTRFKLSLEIGRINGRGEYFSGKWYAARRTKAILDEGQKSASAIQTTGGIRLRAHYVMVSAVARWLFANRPKAVFYPEMMLRKRFGWMEKGRAWAKNCFITPVPDLLVKLGDECWRVEVQLQRRSPEYWLQRIGSAPDLHRVLITGPLPVVRPLQSALPNLHAGRKVRVLEYFGEISGVF
jgi:hypothetical protein